MEFQFRSLSDVQDTDRVSLSGLEFKLLVDVLAAAKIGQTGEVDRFLNVARPVVWRQEVEVLEG